MTAINTIWDQIHQQSDLSLLANLYEIYKSPFTVEVREQCELWIEENLILNNTRLDHLISEHDYQTIFQLLHLLVLEIQAKINELQAGFQRQHSWVFIKQLSQSVQIMKAELATESRTMELFANIRRILNIEAGYYSQQLRATIMNPTVINEASTIAASASHSGMEIMADDDLQSAGPSSRARTIKTNKSCSSIIDTKPPTDFSAVITKYSELKSELNNCNQLIRCILEKKDEFRQEKIRQMQLAENIQRLGQQPTPKNLERVVQLQSELDQRLRSCTNGNEMNQLIQQFQEKITSILKVTEQVIKNEIIAKQLTNYKNGQISLPDLDILQNHCKNIAEILRNSCSQISSLLTICEKEDLKIIQSKFAELYRDFIRQSFVIQVQPRLIVKTKSNLNAILRLLAGTRNSNECPDQITYTDVKASILPQNEATQLVAFATIDENINKPNTNVNYADDYQHQDSGGSIKLLNKDRKETTKIMESGVIENNLQSLMQNSFMVSYKKSVIKSRNRTGSEKGDSVLNTFYWILFHFEMTDKLENGKVQKNWIWTLSHVIKLHVHSGQLCKAYANLTWLNAKNPEDLLTGKKFQEFLDWKTEVEPALAKEHLEITKVALTLEQKEYLKGKVFSARKKNSANNNLSFKEFSEMKIVTKKIKKDEFTFQQWFYETENLSEKHLCGYNGNEGLLQNGYIIGYISRENAEQKLKSVRKPGCVILRFSETELGKIGVTFMKQDGNIESLEPWSVKDLDELDLAQRLHYPLFTYIYKQQENPNTGNISVTIEPIITLAKYKRNFNDNSTRKAKDLNNQYSKKYINNRLQLKVYVNNGLQDKQSTVNGNTLPFTPASFNCLLQTPASCNIHNEAFSFSPHSSLERSAIHMNSSNSADSQRNLEDFDLDLPQILSRFDIFNSCPGISNQISNNSVEYILNNNRDDTNIMDMDAEQSENKNDVNMTDSTDL